MSVTIHYCETCHFEPAARELAAVVERETGLPCTLQKGFWGTFRIVHQGEEIFNRWKTRGWLGAIGCGRNPQPAEIVQILKLRQGAASNRPSGVS